MDLKIKGEMSELSQRIEERGTALAEFLCDLLGIAEGSQPYRSLIVNQKALANLFSDTVAH